MQSLYPNTTRAAIPFSLHGLDNHVGRKTKMKSKEEPLALDTLQVEALKKWQLITDLMR